MKFNCIISDTTLGGHKALFGLLREQNNGTGRHIFVVPDRYTLGVEKEICETLYPDGAFNVDVCSFSRLAQKALGKKNKACLSKEGTVLLLNRVICELSDKLCYYGNVKSVAFSREMFASIAAIRSSKISVEELEEKSTVIQGALGDKLRDIALICRAYEEALAGKYFDSVTRVDWLIKNLGGADYVKNSYIYVLGFNVYSAAQLDFIKRALAFCPSVSVSFPSGMNNPNAECFPYRQRDELLGYCSECGIPVDVRTVTEVLSDTFDFLRRNMYSSKDATKKTSDDEVRIASENNIYEEVKSAAREIRHLAMECGYRYKEIAVAVNNSDFNPLISKTFKRFGIPYFIDEKYQVKNGFFASLVFRVLACACNGTDRRDVMPLVRHPYCGFSREETQIFENYCLKYNIDYSRFLSPFTLGDCDVAEKVREKVAAMVASFPKVAPVEEFCHAVEGLKNEFIEEKEREFAQSKYVPERVYADKEKFLGVVGEIASLCSGDIDVGGFASMLSSVIENMTVSVLPQYLDAVFVGNMSESRFSDVKALFVLGANDGYFPVTTGDKLVLGSYDTEIMRQNGLVVFPSPEESNFFERFALIDLISKPERLYISYSKSATDGTVAAEGGGVREIKYRLGLKERSFSSYYRFEEEERLTYRFGTPENCLFEYISGSVEEEYSSAVREFLVAEGLLDGTDDSSCGADLLKGYAVGEHGYRLSVSKMETYFKCPYKNFLTNVLGLREREEGEIKVNDVGNFIHSVLEKYFSSGEKLREMTDAARKALARKCIESVAAMPEYIRFEENALTKKELDGIKTECKSILETLTENMLHSEFTPMMTEKRFGKDGEIIVTAEGKKFVFSGAVDRVDVCGKDIVVVDYKTGTIDEDLSSVYIGKKIQLYLYLRYFLGLGYKPGGVFYLPIPDGYSKKALSFAMRGQMRNDADMFIKLDNRIKGIENEDYGSPNIAFSATNEGNEIILGSTNAKNLIEEKDFENVTEYVLRLCERALSEIISGEREKKPIVGACEYCPYKKICGDVAIVKGVTADIESFAAEEEDGME